MDPILELQGAIISRLRSHVAVTGIVDQRSYDVPPQDDGRVTATLPYISIGPCSYQSEDADCILGGEVIIQIDAWSDYPGQTEARQMAHAVRSALRGYPFTLTANALVTLDHWRTDHLIDGAIKHASIRFTALVEEPSS